MDNFSEALKALKEMEQTQCETLKFYDKLKNGISEKYCEESKDLTIEKSDEIPTQNVIDYFFILDLAHILIELTYPSIHIDKIYHDTTIISKCTHEIFNLSEDNSKINILVKLNDVNGKIEHHFFILRKVLSTETDETEMLKHPIFQQIKDQCDERQDVGGAIRQIGKKILDICR
ncbi:hypothetical protein SNEBB_004175 [Seison nebaliae]|nr:hypothetical protein SNEBB_004175 [Seison nebaliae]